MLLKAERERRFEFGRNWMNFLSTVNEDRIREAEQSLQLMFGASDLHGKRFLDIGSGSGLFSLAARRLGAEVVSFDYDPQSGACAQQLRSRFFPNDAAWKIEHGSVLDEPYVDSLGLFDLVYSWGVLHHTGDLWKALANAGGRVKMGGGLFIAIYNAQGWLSKMWTQVKRAYVSGPLGKAAVCAIFVPLLFLRSLAASLLKRKNAFGRYAAENRGMSLYHDWLDWLGGTPFEVAKPQRVVDFYARQGFTLEKMTTTRSFGNNQFVFRKTSGA